MKNRLFYALLFIPFVLMPFKVQTQQTQTPLHLNKPKLYSKGIQIGVVDTVVVSQGISGDRKHLNNSDFESINTPTIYVLYADSIPKRKIKAALDKLFPWGTAYILKKGPFQATLLKEKQSVQIYNKHLVRAGEKRIAALITGIAGSGIAVGLIAMKEPVAGGVIGGITALVALFWEFSSASDLIRAGKESAP